MNARTNGDLTVTMVVRFSFGTSLDDERILSVNMADCYLHIWRVAGTGKIRVAVGDSMDHLGTVEITLVDATQWTRIRVTYNTVSLALSVSMNNAAPIIASASSGWFTDARLANGPAFIILGSSSSDPDFYSTKGFRDDLAGFFFVDEVLSSSTITTIKNGMLADMDTSTLCVIGGGGCTGCSAGKYKVGPGPAECTDCGVNTYSEVVSATAAATCTTCPGVLGTSVSDAGNGLLNGCKCNLGYTGPDDTACSACVADSYKPATGSAVCATCVIGKFSTDVARTNIATCQNCPSNSNTVAVGQDASTDCTCNAGYTGLDGVWCDVCVPGKFKAVTGSSACLSCSEGKFSTVTGSVGGHCTNCPTNTNAPVSSSASVACTCNAGYTGGGGLVAYKLLPSHSEHFG